MNACSIKTLKIYSFEPSSAGYVAWCWWLTIEVERKYGQWCTCKQTQTNIKLVFFITNFISLTTSIIGIFKIRFIFTFYESSATLASGVRNGCVQEHCCKAAEHWEEARDDTAYLKKCFICFQLLFFHIVGNISFCFS